MPEDLQRQVRRGPADGLEGEEADERGERGVVEAPAREEAGGEAEALVACEDSLRGGKEGGRVIGYMRVLGGRMRAGVGGGGGEIVRKSAPTKPKQNNQPFLGVVSLLLLLLLRVSRRALGDKYGIGYTACRRWRARWTRGAKIRIKEG